MTSFKDKVVLITGSTAGIGKEIAYEFSRKGASVVISGRRAEEGTQIESEIRSSGGLCRFVRCDVAQSKEVENLVLQTVQIFGKLDIAVNSAGISGPLTVLTEYPEEDWDRTVGINLKGTFLSMKYQIPELIKAGGGVVLNIASALGLRGKPKASVYSATKHGVIGMTKSAAFEYGKYGVRINAACFGGIETEMDREIYKNSENPDQLKKERLRSYALGRMGNVKEAALTAVWLCSNEASFITGAAVPIDGGKTAI